MAPDFCLTFSGPRGFSVAFVCSFLRLEGAFLSVVLLMGLLSLSPWAGSPRSPCFLALDPMFVPTELPSLHFAFQVLGLWKGLTMPGDPKELDTRANPGAQNWLRCGISRLSLSLWGLAMYDPS
jgi:hypothetical protein